MSHRILPYFAGVLKDFSTHGVESWTMVRWLKYVFGHGPRLLAYLAYLYFVAMWQLIGSAGRKRREQMADLAQTHAERLRKLAETAPYDLKTLEHLDGLRATPAEFSVGKMMHVFFLDRILVSAALVIVLILAFIVGGAAGTAIAVAAVIGAVASILGLARRKHSSAAHELRRSAAKIAQETGARYVIFGHSHHPELTNLRHCHGVGHFREDVFYINSGSWVTREILRGDEGQGMTFIEIGAQGAALKKWLGGARPPTALASTTSPPLPVQLAATAS
jgi:hypothetical protein